MAISKALKEIRIERKEAEENEKVLTIKDIMKKHPDVIFHIGSEVGFFFVGDYAEWKTNGSNISTSCKKDFLSKQHAAAFNNPKTIKDLERLFTYDVVDRNAVAMKLAQIQKNADILANEWVPVAQRTPVKVYDRDQGDGIIMIVKGIENGPFWDLEEYNKRWHKNGR